MISFKIGFYKTMTIYPLIFKLQTFYVAYAPGFKVSAYGACQDEALNNLAEELSRHETAAKSTGYEGIRHVNG